MSFYHDDELIPWQMWILEVLGVFFCVVRKIVSSGKGYRTGGIKP